MKAPRFLAQALFLTAALATAPTQATDSDSTTTVIGQWNFNSANLSAAAVGSPLVFSGFTPVGTQDQINGIMAGVLSLPATSPEQHILATFAPTNNADGTNLNQYTIIMDLKWAPESEGTWRGLFNTDTNNSTDAEIFVNPDGRIGNFNAYAGKMDPSQWYRLVLVYDLATNQMTRYLNGTNAAGTDAGPTTLPLPDAEIDGRFSLNDSVLFLSDNDGETAPVLVNVIQLRAGAMTDAEVAALGGPASSGLDDEGEPAGDVEILSIVRNGTNVDISVTPGRTVQLQRTANIATPSWSNVATGSGTLSAPITGTLGFFRVQVLN